MKKYDLIVLGAGPGGYVAAIKAAQNNLKVAIIENEALGGICLNHGCIPTKSMLKSTKTYDLIKNAKDFGINVGDVSYDIAKIVKRKDGVVRRLTMGVKSLLTKNKVDIYNGYGEVLSSTEVKVKDETLTAKNLILATGGTAFIPPINGARTQYKEGFLVTSRELLNVKNVPKELIIVGGGVIGVEFATIFNQLGSKVTIVEMAPTIITQMDEDIIQEYTKLLLSQGVNIITNAAVNKIDKGVITYKKDNKDHQLKGDLLLMAVGIKPSINAFAKLNLKMHKGDLVVNEKMETSIKNVYAIGDVTGKHMLAHVASTEGIVAVNNILGINDSINYDQVPSGIYGSPEIATIGLTEKEAKARGVKYSVSKFPLMANGKSLADGERDGFIKIIKGTELDEILGAHILAYNAVDLIGEIGVAMKLEGTNKELANTIHAHPSLSEIILEAAMDKPIHM